MNRKKWSTPTSLTSRIVYKIKDRLGFTKTVEADQEGNFYIPGTSQKIEVN